MRFLAPTESSGCLATKRWNSNECYGESFMNNQMITKLQFLHRFPALASQNSRQPEIVRADETQSRNDSEFPPALPPVFTTRQIRHPKMHEHCSLALEEARCDPYSPAAVQNRSMRRPSETSSSPSTKEMMTAACMFLSM